MPEDDRPSYLSPADARRLQQIMNAMPYGYHLMPLRGIKTVDDVVKTLEGLKERLTHHAKGEERRDAELTKLRDLMRGGRSLLAELMRPEPQPAAESEGD